MRKISDVYIVRTDAEDRWSDVVIHNNTLWYARRENLDADALFEQTATWRKLMRCWKNRAPVRRILMPLFS